MLANTAIRRKKIISFLAYPAVFLSFFVIFAGALMVSKSYRIAMIQQTTSGGGILLTGGGYRMLGTAGQLTSASLQSANYTLGTGIINLSRPPQADLSTAHAFPNPYKAPIHRNHGIRFTRLTLKATIRIYTISGELVRTLYKGDNTDELDWNVRGENGQKLASGLYFYFIKSGNSIKKGKLVIIQ